MLKFTKILVPLDGSENSHRALAYASYLAGCCGASVGVLHVVNLSSKVAAIGQLGTGGYVPDGVLDELQDTGRSIIDEALALLPSGIAAKGFVEVGRPTDKIVTFCGTNGYDLIIIGSRGLGAIEQLVLGSVSSFVLHHASCPVMIVR